MPETIITRKLKSVKIIWIRTMDRENFFICILISVRTSVCGILAHTCTDDHSWYLLIPTLQTENVKGMQLQKEIAWYVVQELLHEAMKCEMLSGWILV